MAAILFFTVDCIVIGSYIVIYCRLDTESLVAISLLIYCRFYTESLVAISLLTVDCVESLHCNYIVIYTGQHRVIGISVNCWQKINLNMHVKMMSEWECFQIWIPISDGKHMQNFRSRLQRPNWIIKNVNSPYKFFQINSM